MKKITKKILILGLSINLLCLTGCSNPFANKSASEIITNSIEYMQTYDSFDANVTYTLGVGSDNEQLSTSDTTDPATDTATEDKTDATTETTEDTNIDKYTNIFKNQYDMNVKFKNGVTNMEGNSTTSMMGQTNTTSINIYTYKDNDTYDTYTLNNENKQWEVSSQVASSNNFTTKDIATFFKKFSEENMQNAAVVEKKENNYIITIDFSKISSDDWKKILTVEDENDSISTIVSSMKDSYSMQKIEDLKMIYTVSTKEYMPKNVELIVKGYNVYSGTELDADSNDNNEYKSYMEILISFTFNSFGKTDISIPDDVKNNAVKMTDDSSTIETSDESSTEMTDDLLTTETTN